MRSGATGSRLGPTGARAEPRRVLVTGASGFVGRSVLREFVATGHSVTGTSTSGGDPSAELNLDRPDQIADVLEELRPEVIIHLAGLQSVPESWQYPARAFRVNTGGTATLLREVERLTPESHFVLASSAAVYGDPPPAKVGRDAIAAADQPSEGGERTQATARPFEETDPMQPESPYGASKAAAEVLTLEAAARTGMPLTIARMFNQIGADQPAGQVPAEFAAAIARAEAEGESRVVLEVGDPAKARDFTDTRDTARALRRTAELGITGRLNFCTGETHSLTRVIEGLSRLSRIEVVVRRSPEKSNPNDPLAIGGCPALLKQATGWSPGIGLDESLADLLEARRAAQRPD